MKLNLSLSYLLVHFFITITPYVQADPTLTAQTPAARSSIARLERIKKGALNLLFTGISHGSSDQLHQQANQLNQQLTAKDHVTVRQLNWLGKLLIGSKNTISIPFINYIFVNEKWLNSLPSDKSKEFILGRALMYLSAFKNEYLICHYALPFFMHNAIRLINEYALSYKSLSPQVARCIYYLSELSTRLLLPYFSRSIEYRIDAQTVTKFDCLEGAQAALLDSVTNSPQENILIRANTFVSVVELLDLFVHLLPLYGHINKSINNNDGSLEHDPLLFKISEIALSLPLYSRLKYVLPGRFNDRQSIVLNFIKNIPLINLLFDSPRPSKRVKELLELKRLYLRNRFADSRRLQSQ